MNTLRALRPLVARRLRAGSGASSPAEMHRVEHVLARARVFLASAATLTALLDPAPWAANALIGVLIVAYLIHSTAILAVLSRRTALSPALGVAIHAVDILWAGSIILVTNGPDSPFFVFFIFVVLAAAYRWGFWETLATSGVAIVLFVAQANLLWSHGEIGRLFTGTFDLHELIMGLSYLLLAGLLLGYLAEEDKGLRTEARTLARIMLGMQREIGFRSALRTLATELLNTFRARHLAIVVEDAETGKAYVWKATGDAGADRPDVAAEELQEADRETYLFDMPAPAWLGVRPLAGPRNGPWQIVRLPADGGRSRRSSERLPASFVDAHTQNTVMCVAFGAGTEWTGRLFLIGIPRAGAGATALGFLQTLVRQAGPAIYSLYLVRRLRARAGALERARVARELHDGVIQSLIGVEMQLDVLRRQSADGTSVATDLERIQELVREEVISLRELMRELRPVDVTPADLVDYLADLVDRFGRETGISARFVSDLNDVPLSARVCRELVLIVQEALVNVRKHSGARNVIVRLSVDRGTWHLTIDEDGRGFAFAGRLPQAELDARRKGPIVIKERVRAIGGELTIDSTPGRGARLEITFPQVARG